MCTQTVQTTLWKSLVVEKEEMAGVGGVLRDALKQHWL